MSKTLDRVHDLIAGGDDFKDALGIATAEQLERIADALMKQSAGKEKPISEITVLLTVDTEAASIDVCNGMEIEEAILKNLKVT